MRRIIGINDNWKFKMRSYEEMISIPHTWNGQDGQDGGNDYYRGIASYTRKIPMPQFDAAEEEVFLEFQGVNSSAEVWFNTELLQTHDGGYATFRVNITDKLQAHNELVVKVDNQKNDYVYPQKADFTFYGGIYRDVNLVIVNKKHFELEHWGTPGLRVTAIPGGKKAKVTVEAYLNTADAQVFVTCKDAQGNIVAETTVHELIANGEDSQNVGFAPLDGYTARTTLEIEDVHLWDGVIDPYLYTTEVSLRVEEEEVDRICTRFGVRSFYVDPKEGFFLNGRAYPLHGVSRHQDYKELGNAIHREEHIRDMEMIKELGCNTVRLAHYQHDQFFYDLCDEAGMIVWAEIPYISEHMPNGRENTISQMKELIVQNYNHPCIVTWGLSNEITISTRKKRDMLDNHRVLNDLCHKMDATRVTTLACYAMCNPFAKVVHISDIVSYNLYLGWYVPGLFLNDVFLTLFHLRYPKRCLGYSEYGAEGMWNLHSEHPKRGDHTEEYQAKYHEYMVKCFARHPWMWSTHVWNMFDFAADARNQGGEPGMNHKGLVTFDRKIKKDSFFLYKSYWNSEPMVHICSKRFEERGKSNITLKVYSNQPEVTLYQNGIMVATKKANHVFEFPVVLKEGENHFEAVAGDWKDEATFIKKKNPKSYKLDKKKSKSANWV